MIGLIYYHQARSSIKNFNDRGVVKKIARGIVRVGQEDQRWLMLLDGSEHFIQIKGEIVFQQHSCITHTCESRNHAEHHECGFDAQ